MTPASESAWVRLILADYIAPDPQGKINMIGGAIDQVGVDPNGGGTAPFGVLAMATFDPKLIGQTPTIELRLETQDGELVPFDAGDGGIQNVVIGMTESLRRPDRPGFPGEAPVNRLRQQIVVNFSTGLPLKDAAVYVWRVVIDGSSRDDWTEMFYVQPAPPIEGLSPR